MLVYPFLAGSVWQFLSLKQRVNTVVMRCSTAHRSWMIQKHPINFTVCAYQCVSVGCTVLRKEWPTLFWRTMWAFSGQMYTALCILKCRSTLGAHKTRNIQYADFNHLSHLEMLQSLLTKATIDYEWLLPTHLELPCLHIKRPAFSWVLSRNSGSI